MYFRSTVLSMARSTIISAVAATGSHILGATFLIHPTRYLSFLFQNGSHGNASWDYHSARGNRFVSGTSKSQNGHAPSANLSSPLYQIHDLDYQHFLCRRVPHNLLVISMHVKPWQMPSEPRSVLAAWTSWSPREPKPPSATMEQQL